MMAPSRGGGATDCEATGWWPLRLAPSPQREMTGWWIH